MCYAAAAQHGQSACAKGGGENGPLTDHRDQDQAGEAPVRLDRRQYVR